MNHITCHVVQDTNSSQSGNAMLRVEDLGGGLTQLRLEFGPTSTRFVLAESTLAQLHELIGQRVTENEALLAPKLKAVQ